jgi:hypothetical protein
MEVNMLGDKTIINPNVQKAIIVLNKGDFDVKEISDLLEMSDMEIYAFLKSKGMLKKVV